MKGLKLFLISLIFFLAVPFVSAEINLYSFSSDSYSLGDAVLFRGDVKRDESIRGTLDIFLKCGSEREQAGSELLDLNSGQARGFSNYVYIPSSLAGKCNAELVFSDLNGSMLESGIFEGFTILKNLNGNFQVNKNNFQLGEVLGLTGYVSKPNGQAVDGSALIKFKRDGAPKFLGNAEIKQGRLNFEKELVRVPPGSYSADFFVTDNFGNENTFLDILSFSVESSINININLQKNSFDPGDEVILTGYVSSNLNQRLEDISAEVSFEGADPVIQNLADSSVSFSFKYFIPENAKTKNYAVEITAKDNEGNYGFETFDYNVNAIPTNLDLSLSGGSFNPEETAGFTVSLLDQAGDPINDAVNVNLFDSDGEIVFNKVARTGVSDSFVLPEHAEPGLWKISAEGFGLSDEAAVNVNQYQKLDASLQGSELVVSNNGNVPFKDSINIEAGDLSKSKKLGIKVGESEKVSLDKLFPFGNYQVRVPSLGKVFDNVRVGKEKTSFGFGNIFGKSRDKVTGNVTRNVNDPSRKGLLFLALILLGGGLVYLVLGRRKSRKEASIYEFKGVNGKGYTEGKKKLEELKAKGVRKEREPVYGKATNEDVEYWKKRVQEVYKEQEDKDRNREFLDRTKRSIDENKPKPGLFNMFG